MMQMNKMMFMMILMIGTFITISSYSWMGMWMGLEINLLSIIPLMNSSKTSTSSESSLKYFITQALASTILLYSIIMLMKSSMNYPLKNSMLMVLNTAMFTKMGAAPFHFWFPEIMEGLNWFNSLIVLTWQKIAPMMIAMTNATTMNYTIIIILTSMIIGGIMGLNQTSLRKILAYSSINHIGWMIAAYTLNFMIWIIYFLTYSLISMILIFLFNKIQVFNMNQLILHMKTNEMLKLSVNMNFLSFGGVPPFIGFFPKWTILNSLMNSSAQLLSIIMVILTLITLFYYTRIILSSMMLINDQLNYSNKTKIKSFVFYLVNSANLLGLVILIWIFN
uniref:NADH-ubiquinone oxidoreductase chain 2 n=1 Tax=Bostrichoidea sp. 9 KM-2017 TaxID=2219283 RepID=A0A346RH23_9COLE|nr:NADH dehydrogenase subunit 2 [Bostrichoidea sp. 9 KM-2017]